MTISQPIACWELDNALTDATGGGKTLVNASGSYVTGKVGTHARRTSVSASQSNAAFSAIATAAWSVSLWFKWTFVDGDYTGFAFRLANAGATDETNFTLDTHASNSIEFVSASGAVIQDITAYATINDWNHAVVTWNGTMVKLYLNGVLRANGSDGTAGFAAAAAGLVMEVAVTNFDFDQLAIWSSAITEAEAVELYAAGAGLAYSNPWPAAAAASGAGRLLLLGVG